MKIKGIINLEKLNLDNMDEIINHKKGFFTYQNISYFYKRCKDDYAYRELIANEVCNILNIPAVNYYLIKIPEGRFEGSSGVVALDYRKTDTLYIKGYNILKDYYKEYLKIWSSNDRKNNYNFNNLENIWQSLKYRYRFDNNSDLIIKNIFDSLICNLFLFDIFLSNGDRHFHNWEVVENSRIFLNMNYDNEDIFLKNYKIPNLSVNQSSKDYDYYDTLKEFLNVFEGKYFNDVMYMYQKLDTNVIYKVFKLVELKHNIKIPDYTKNDILKKYFIHYETIGKIIKDYDNKKLIKL